DAAASKEREGAITVVVSMVVGGPKRSSTPPKCFGNANRGSGKHSRTLQVSAFQHWLRYPSDPEGTSGREVAFAVVACGPHYFPRRVPTISAIMTAIADYASETVSTPIETQPAILEPWSLATRIAFRF